ncbi:MAG: aldolase/citrate lyase family protein [Rhodoferax sp.]|uniref:HpcH/HpaI aldolase/citrate lyase family protein n=1 Tax=Rhodoferax sp. TaxID=50421 RepID=UPI00271B2849|nr:aldolase/citrate lyase family protein [Rhodoferax sp.]MDO8447207.1 aldolase/citrate lyase family protein [Rhodoferax sp.]
MRHPREVLLGAQAAAVSLPVCDHYSGVEARMIKSLALQAEMSAEFGACVFDVTLDCEDGAPVGGEKDHANMVVALANQAHLAAKNIAFDITPRVAARVHAVDHPAFEQDLDIIVGGAAAALCHVMIPKVETVADVDRAARLVDQAACRSGRSHPLPLHVLIESPASVHRAFEIAAHPRVQSLSFGLMDFVSSHGGAIPASAMGIAASPDADDLDQFSHPLVLRAKLEIASACHAQGKVPAHCVVTEFSDTAAVQAAATRACRALGYTRMWSIHPAQIRPILEAFAPQAHEIELAANIMAAAEKADWAPISLGGKLHDRASYRYFWQVLERAHQTGRRLPDEARVYFSV